MGQAAETRPFSSGALSVASDDGARGSLTQSAVAGLDATASRVPRAAGSPTASVMSTATGSSHNSVLVRERQQRSIARATLSSQESHAVLCVCVRERARVRSGCKNHMHHTCTLMHRTSRAWTLGRRAQYHPHLDHTAGLVLAAAEKPNARSLTI